MLDGRGGSQVTGRSVGPLQKLLSVIHCTPVPTQLRLSQVLTAEKAAGDEGEKWQENACRCRGRRSPAAQGGRGALERTGGWTKQERKPAVENPKLKPAWGVNTGEEISS